MNDDWEATRQANDHLRQQLHALAVGSRSRWKKFRLLEVVCRKCGDTVLEVMDTKPYRVMRTWESRESKGGSPAAWWGKGWSMAEIQRAAYADAKARTDLVRRGDSMFDPISNDWKGDSDELITTACRCRGHDLRGDTVADWLHSTRRKKLI